ncbi:MAG: hypothetical protein V3T82_03670 [Nitrospinaceae bacterium]
MDLNALLLQKTKCSQRIEFKERADDKVKNIFERENHVIALLSTLTLFLIAFVVDFEPTVIYIADFLPDTF